MSVGDHHNKELADIKQTANPLMRAKVVNRTFKRNHQNKVVPKT